MVDCSKQSGENQLDGNNETSVYTHHLQIAQLPAIFFCACPISIVCVDAVRLLINELIFFIKVNPNIYALYISRIRNGSNTLASLANIVKLIFITNEISLFN